MNLLGKFVFSINLFFLLFLGVFLPNIGFKNSSFSEESLQLNEDKKVFYAPLIKFFKFQGSSASDLYNYTMSKEQQVELSKKFDESKEYLPIFAALLSPSPLSSSCNNNLIKEVTNSANILIFLKTSCSKEIIISGVKKKNFLPNQISSIIPFPINLPELTDQKREKMIEDLEKIKFQLIGKFLKTKDGDSFKVTNARGRDINFSNLKKKKNLNFDKLLPQEKTEITKLAKKINKFNIESNWKVVLDRELFKKIALEETNSSHGLFIGLGVGGGVFLLIVMGTGYYFYKKHKNKQKNV